MSKQNQWIVGVNAVASAIENDADNVREVLVEGGSKNARLTEIEENARRKGIDVRRVTGQALDGVAGSLRHQGVAARYAAAKGRRFRRRWPCASRRRSGRRWTHCCACRRPTIPRRRATARMKSR